MKPKISLFLAASFYTAVFSSSAFAAQLFKDSTGTDINTLANWSTTNGAATPDPVSFGTSDQLRFNENTAATGTFTMDLSAALTVGDITVDSATGGGGSATGNFVIDSANNSTLTLNGGGNPSYTTSGIVLNSSAGGTLTVNCDIALGATPVRFTTSRALTVNGDIALGANTLEFNTAGSTTTLAGVISGTGALNKAAGGQILALTNTANDFGGQVTLVGGTTQVTKLAPIGNNSSLGSGNGASLITLNGAVLTYTGAGGDTTDRALSLNAASNIINNNSATGAISFTAANASHAAVAPRTLTLGGSNVNDNTFGSILGDSGTTPNITSLTKSGAGKWILSAANSYSGATTITAGTLSVGATGNLGAAASNLVFDGGTLQITGNTLATVSGMGHTVLFGATKTVGLDINNPAHTFTVDQVLDQTTGGFTKAGAGTAILNQVNIYTGTTTVSGGTLELSGGSAIADTGAVSLSNTAGVLLKLNANETVGSLSGGGATGGNLDLEGNTLTLASSATTFGGNISGSGGSMVKNGAGNFVLTGSNTFTGSTTVTGGFLVFDSLTAENGGGALALNGGNLALGGDFAGNTATIGSLSGNSTTSSINPNFDANTGVKTLEVNQTVNGIFQGKIEIGSTSRNMALTKSGSASLTLTGTNTYTGATSITGGTLALGASNVLANTAVSIGAATLAVGTGFSDTIGTLDPTAAAAINLGTGATLAFAQSNGIDWTDGTLNITGNFVPGNLGSLRFGDNLTQPGLTGDQLLKITAAGFTGFGLDADGYLTATPAAGFAAWQSANVTNQTINQDHDNDGVSNGVEFFIGGPNNTTGFTSQPAISGTSVTYAKHPDYPGTYGANFVIETSETLVGAWTPETVGGSVVQSVNNFTYTFPGGGPAKKFVRLKVTEP